MRAGGALQLDFARQRAEQSDRSNKASPRVEAAPEIICVLAITRRAISE
jgi:hypothetical protein